MSIQATLLPLFVQVLLTLGLCLWLSYRRGRDIVSGSTDIRDIALREQKWSTQTQQIGNCFLNQFELPVLFYVLTILVIITRKADLLFVALAWVFVACRLIHAAIHCTGNDVRSRGSVWGIAALVLLVMWLVFIVRILAAD